jgi:hypothetical protein
MHREASIVANCKQIGFDTLNDAQPSSTPSFNVSIMRKDLLKLGVLVDADSNTFSEGFIEVKPHTVVAEVIWSSRLCCKDDSLNTGVSCSGGHPSDENVCNETNSD